MFVLPARGYCPPWGVFCIIASKMGLDCVVSLSLIWDPSRAEYVISSRRVASESTLMIPNNFLMGFHGEALLAHRPTPSWRTNTRRLSATAYSIYSHLPSISESRSQIFELLHTFNEIIINLHTVTSSHILIPRHNQVLSFISIYFSSSLLSSNY